MLRPSLFAGIATVLAASALAASGTKPAGDANVSLRLSCRPLSEVARLMSSADGNRFEAAPEIAEWKVSLLYHGPVSRLVMQLCSHFHLVVRNREVGAGTRVKVLGLSETERDRLARYYADRDQELRRQRAEDSAQLADAVRRTDQEERGLTNSRPFQQLLSGLPPDAVQQACASTRTSPDDPEDRSPGLALDAAALSQPQRDLLQQGVRDTLTGLSDPSAPPVLQDISRGAPGVRLEFWVSNDARHGGQLLHLTVRDPAAGWFSDFHVAGAANADVARQGGPGAGQRPAPAQAAPAPPAEIPEQEQRALNLALQGGYGDSVLALADAAGIDLIADGFTLRERVRIAERAAQLNRVLDVFGDAFKVQRRWSGQTLLIRSKHWEDRLLEEPPADVADNLVHLIRDEHRLPTEPEMARAAARLTRPQLRGLSRWHGEDVDLQPVALKIMNGYPVWRWATTLSDGEWTAIRSGGLPVTQLNPQQREGLAVLASAGGIHDLRAVSRLQWRDHPEISSEFSVLMLAGDGTVLGDVR